MLMVSKLFQKSQFTTIIIAGWVVVATILALDELAPMTHLQEMLEYGNAIIKASFSDFTSND